MLYRELSPAVLEAKLFHVPSYGRSPERTVMDYEFDFYLSGKRDMWLDGVHFPVQSGNLVFRKPGQRVSSSGDYDCYILTLDFSGRPSDKNYSRNLTPDLQPKADSPLLARLPPVLVPTHHGEYLRLFRKIAEQFPYPDQADRLSDLALQLLYLAAADSLRQAEPALSSPSHVHRLCEYLTEHYSEPITLNQLADLVHLNKSYLVRLFRKETGISPVEYLIRVRMDSARSLLLKTDANIATVAELCGYKNVPFFITCFKRRFGVPPAQFRTLATEESHFSDRL